MARPRTQRKSLAQPQKTNESQPPSRRQSARVKVEQEPIQDDQPSSRRTRRSFVVKVPSIGHDSEGSLASPDDGAVGSVASSYHTPGTSVAATPANEESKNTRVSAAKRASELKNHQFSLGKAKSEFDDDILDSSFSELSELSDSEDDFHPATRGIIINGSPQKLKGKTALSLPVRQEKKSSGRTRGSKASLTASKSEKTSSVGGEKLPGPSILASDSDNPLILGSGLGKKRKTGGQPDTNITSASSKRRRILNISDDETSQIETPLPELNEQNLQLVSQNQEASGEVDSDFSDLSTDVSGASVILGERVRNKSHRARLIRMRRRMGTAGRRGTRRYDRSRIQSSIHLSPEEKRRHTIRRGLKKHHSFMKSMWTELKNTPPIAKERAPQPSGIIQRLKPFQLEGLNWLIKQEQTKWKGGLLADEMGMGKTIQAVSLIMSDYPQPNPTLVVVPPVALMQWQQEIASYTDGKLKVLVYHGTNSKAKKLSKAALKKHDVIMISYSGLESMYRKQVKGFNRKDEDGDPINVREDSVIHEIHFHRVILDEAHNIKSRSTSSAKACCELKADFRWCLSGTPLQNRIGELFSLLRFLQVRPFAMYACKSCSCNSMDWEVGEGGQCAKCPHVALQHVSLFNHELLDPIKRSSTTEEREDAFRRLKLLTDAIMLRREKRFNTSSMELPMKHVEIDKQFFGEVERDFAGSIMSNNQRRFDNYVAQGVELNNYANIFGLIMQMRQVADHPDLLLKKHAPAGQTVAVCVICNEPAEDVIASLCKHDFCRSCALGYVESFEGVGDTPDCPKCHMALSIDLEQEEKIQEYEGVKKNSIINKINMQKWTSSSKIEMLICKLTDIRIKGLCTKSIVFSQFTSMLQLIQWRLKNAGFLSVMLDGSMTPAQRQASIEYFMKNPEVEVFLVSLKAGGVALNLTEASQVFLVDPWWNPAAEWQSADRCHRIGQNRPVTVTRLVIEDSVESRIVALQEKKANMIHSTVNADQTALANLSRTDVQFLFQG